jgi:oxygen-dependent protoporphyrinogen oxidase
VVRLSASVESITSLAAYAMPPGSWILRVRGETNPQYFDDLILATPGTVSSRLLRGVDDQLADLISRVTYAGCSVAVLGIRRDQLAKPLNGFGFVAPTIEKRQIIAGSLASLKFPGRAPEGKLLLRVFVGGALQPHLAQLAEDEIRQIVLRELNELLGLSGEPEFFEVARWPGMMPQYHVGHLELVRQIEERAAAILNFALAGNAFRGVGVPFCVRSGEQAAETVVKATTSGRGE